MSENAAGTLAQALIDEHHEIDSGIEAFIKHASDNPDGASFAQWAKPLQNALTALRRHIYLEEEFAFPPLNTGGRAIALMVMYREHGEIWRAMDNLDHLLEDGVEASGIAEAVAQCRSMLEVLEKHNEKEEPVIYPHLGSELDPVAQARLQEFIASGSMPAAWVCRDA